MCIRDRINGMPTRFADCNEPPNCWVGYFHKDFGRFLNVKGYYSRGLDELQEAEQFPGRDQDDYVLAGIGDAYAGLHDPNEACRYYDKALKIAGREPIQTAKRTAGCPVSSSPQ